MSRLAFSACSVTSGSDRLLTSKSHADEGEGRHGSAVIVWRGADSWLRSIAPRAGKISLWNLRRFRIAFRQSPDNLLGD
jgi:hypothetical protein